MSAPPSIAVVDDDVSVRESLSGLLSTLGFSPSAFACARDFLDSATLAATDCLILDVEMPTMTGPELLLELAGRRMRIPVIFITAHASEEVRLSMSRQGAVACLSKPFTEAALIDALRNVLPGTRPQGGG